MKKVGLKLLMVLAIVVALGGIGELTIQQPLGVHVDFLKGDFPDGTLGSATASMLLNLLHALGAGILAAGISMFLFVRYGIAKGEAWGMAGYLSVITICEGMNAYGMFQVNSFFYIPLAYMALAYLGAGLIYFGKKKENH